MLDQAQINTLNAVERMGATLSLLGITLVFITFTIFKRLRSIPNTFIFFASIANIGACVACLIAYDGISAMNRDRSSPLCQAQGFIFEWYVTKNPGYSRFLCNRLLTLKLNIGSCSRTLGGPSPWPSTCIWFSSRPSTLIPSADIFGFTASSVTVCLRSQPLCSCSSDHPGA